MDDARDAILLDDLRRRAERLLSPWTPRDASVDDLSPARAKAVRAAARELVAVAGELARLRDEPWPEDIVIEPEKKPSRPKSRRNVEDDLRSVTPGIERTVGVTLSDLRDLMILDSLTGFGPQKFRMLHDAGISPSDVVRMPEKLNVPGRAGDAFRQALASRDNAEDELALGRAARQIMVAYEHGGQILTYRSSQYPRNVLKSNNAIPILYARGNTSILTNARAVACVGSRNIAGVYAELHRDFAAHAAGRGVVIVSGFALGADTIGHKAAIGRGGATVCVMPSGLDRPFPPENRSLWDDLLQRGDAVMLSEFPFGTASSSMNLRKRNKLIVSAASGVLVSQSSAKGGAMNAYRFAVEQRKSLATFKPDTYADSALDAPTSGNLAIAHETRVPTVVFSLENSVHEWDRWLDQLS
jgi:DNA protecting protein DprA